MLVAPLAKATADMATFGAESSALLATRLTVGDVETARLISSSGVDVSAAERHPHQLSGIIESVAEQRAARIEITEADDR